MPVLTSTVHVRAALPSVAAAVRLRDTVTRPATRLAPGLRLPLRWRLEEVALGRLSRVQTGGPPLHLEHLSTLVETSTGTRLTERVRWRAALPAAHLLVGAALRRRMAWIRARAERLHAAPAVVGAAIVRDGRVLAQQRARPAELAGRWELPGGRVEPGERAPDALARECREELAVRVVAGPQIGPDVPLPTGLVLRIHAAWLADPAARPVAVEHAALRWVGPEELSALDWLDSDRAVLPELATILTDATTTFDPPATVDPPVTLSDATAEPGDRPVP